MKKVYIAGPYTQGDVDWNIRHAITVADCLIDCGFAPYIPHLSHFHNLVFPRPYEKWLELDQEWLMCCDAVLRLDGESFGADKEVALAVRHGIPVFRSIDKLVEKLKQ